MIDYRELSTPLSTEHFTAHREGNVYGLPAIPQRYRHSWLGTRTPVKNLYLTGADAGEFRFLPGGPGWLHPGRAATVWRGDRAVGWVGQLDPRLQRALDLDDDVYVFELELDGASRRSVPSAEPVSRFPSLRRDIAVVLSDDIPYADIAAAIRAAVGERLVDLVLFDRYAGPNLGNGVRSLAMGLILQDRSRTLTDQDADQCVDLAVSALATGYNAKLRG